MKLRSWATPATLGAFVLIAATGVLMFFHLDSGLNKTAHEWLGWALIVAVVAHVTVNFRAFKGYFRRPAALTVIGAFVLVLGLSFLPLGGGNGAPPVRAMLGALNSAPIEAVAAVAGKDADVLIADLRGKGYATAERGKSLNAIANGDSAKGQSLLSEIFAAE